MIKGVVFKGLCLLFFLQAPNLWACDSFGVTGFFPENDLYLPVGLKSGGGLSEEQFHRIVEATKNVYGPIFEQMGGSLEIIADWEDGTVNAYAYPGVWGTSYVAMMGGLARHPLMTEVSFLMVACHEIGHHLGGRPFYSGLWGPSVEGQSDLFSATFCTKRVLQEMGIGQSGAHQGPSSQDKDFFEKSCQSYHPQDKEGRRLCQSVALGGRDLANFLADISCSDESCSAVDITVSDPNVVEETLEGHPEAQCRFDTYYKGALCAQSHMEIPEDGKAYSYCLDSRPRCWYAPSSEEEDDSWWPWFAQQEEQPGPEETL